MLLPAASDPTVLLWFTLLLVLITLVVSTRFRFRQLNQETSPGETSLTRPYLALLLVGSVVILTAASLGMEKPDLQKALIGAVISWPLCRCRLFFLPTLTYVPRQRLSCSIHRRV